MTWLLSTVFDYFFIAINMFIFYDKYIYIDMEVWALFFICELSKNRQETTSL